MGPENPRRATPRLARPAARPPRAQPRDATLHTRKPRAARPHGATHLQRTLALLPAQLALLAQRLSPACAHEKARARRALPLRAGARRGEVAPRGGARRGEAAGQWSWGLHWDLYDAVDPLLRFVVEASTRRRARSVCGAARTERRSDTLGLRLRRAVTCEACAGREQLCDR
jgi:hypothetical protein